MDVSPLVLLPTISQYAENNDIEPDMIFEVSAKEGTGIQEMLDAVALKIKPEARVAKPVEKTGKQNCNC